MKDQIHCLRKGHLWVSFTPSSYGTRTNRFIMAVCLKSHPGSLLAPLLVSSFSYQFLLGTLPLKIICTSIVILEAASEEPSFPDGSEGKDSTCNVGDLGSIPGFGRFPGEGNSYPLQYPGLANSMDRGDWRATVHGVKKTLTWPSDFQFLKNQIENSSS